jgi:PHD/YefM family antitoxin component YafN of YafNO toxin-antitoxin module
MSTAVSVPSGCLTSRFIEKVRHTFKQKKVVLLSEDDYKEMLKAKHNAEYLAKLDMSFREIENGKIVAFDMEELEAMAR